MGAAAKEPVKAGELARCIFLLDEEDLGVLRRCLCSYALVAVSCNMECSIVFFVAGVIVSDL